MNTKVCAFMMLGLFANIYSADKKDLARSAVLKDEETLSSLVAKYHQEKYEKEKAVRALKRLALVLTMPDETDVRGLIFDPENISYKAEKFALCLMGSLHKADLKARLHKKEIENITDLLVSDDKKPFCMRRSDYNREMISLASLNARLDLAAEDTGVLSASDRLPQHIEFLKGAEIRDLFQRYVPTYMHHFPGEVSRGVSIRSQRVVKIARDATVGAVIDEK